MDQTLTGSAGIASTETFGGGGAMSIFLTGAAGIPSGETFSPRTGVAIDPFSVPTSIWLSY